MVIVPKRGRGRKPKPKAMDEPMHQVPGGFCEKMEKSKSNNEEEYFEED